MSKTNDPTVVDAALDFSRFSVSDGKEDENNANKVLHAKYSLQHNRLHLEAIEYKCTLQ